MISRLFLVFVLEICFCFASLFAQTVRVPQRKVTKLADNVYEIQHADALPDFPEGNTTVIIGEDSVFVIDSAFLPSSARKDVEQIRQWTSKPVRYLMNTHGHYDHNTGNGIYARDFPGSPSLRTVRHAT